MTTYGDPRLPARFWAKVRQEDGHWLWTGGDDGHGYGMPRKAEGGDVGTRRRRAHRLAYEALVAVPPDGWHIDHLCRVLRCICPDHLEAVPHRINVLRGVGPTAVNAAKTHCPSGHPYEGQNVGYRKDGGRRCQTCNNEHQKAWRARRASA